jgi:hypothetical protein
VVGVAVVEMKLESKVKSWEGKVSSQMSGESDKILVLLLLPCGMSCQEMFKCPN